MTRGRFLSFEGIDGAGKSTQHAWVVDYLRDHGHTVVSTREPGGTPLGEKLRTLLLAESMHLETEALLMFAARREHVAQVIEPALARGEWVVCDRFVDASFAYQGGGRGLDWNKLEALSAWVLGDLQPDVTFFFDAPVAVAQKRLHAASGNRDRFEQEQAEFFERVRAAYLRIAQENPIRVQRIDATQTPESINNLLAKIIATL
ncbi:MAG: dTMP kinase [Sulfuritalea sp.]|nr:dTMP kinase [Sulfuritalea sp.]